MPYVWIDDLGEFKHYDERYIIKDEEYESFYETYQERIERGEGTAFFDDGKLIFEEAMTNILVNKKLGYYNEVDTPIDNEDYETKEVSYTEYLKYQKEKDAGKIVIYKDDRFIVITLQQDEEYDFTNGKVFINYDTRRYRILGNFDVDTVLADIQYRGFKYVFNGKEYFQPFRDINDKYTFLASRALSPKDRILKFYSKREKDTKSYFDTIKGEIITDEFLNKMIKDYQIFESFTKREVEEYLDKIKDTKKEEDFFRIKSNYIDEILNMVVVKYGK